MIYVDNFYLDDKYELNRHEILWRALDAAKRRSEYEGFYIARCVALGEITKEEGKTRYTIQVWGHVNV